MLKVDIGQMVREGSASVEARLAPDAEVWSDTDLKWSGEVEARFRAAFAGTGEVVARGVVQGTLAQECRRCLEPVDTPFDQELTIVFVADGSDDGDGSYAFDEGSSELDLSDAVREEVVLAVDPYVLCTPECKGLCPKCGINRNTGNCDCTEEHVDPRWAALRELKSEQ